MKIHKQFPGRVQNISQKMFFNFYFLNVDISFIIHDTHLKLYICIENIAVEGTVSQIFYIGPGSISIKSRRKYSKKYIKSCPFFLHKIKTKTSNEILRHSSLNVNVIYSHKKS